MRAGAGPDARAKRRKERGLESSEFADLRTQSSGGSKGGGPSWSQDEVREGEAVSAASVGRGKAKLSPSKKPLWEIVACP
jgi:hypothetical protein